VSVRRAGVVGYPVAQSLSPKLHGRWLAELGIQGEYLALEVRPERLKQAFSELLAAGFSGWNVTVPHKEEALALVDSVDETARRIGAVNTVVVRDGKLHGTNTDAYGFMQNLKAKAGDISSYRQHAVVRGAGGAARAVIHALKEEGFARITIVNRTLKRAEVLASQFGVDAKAWEFLPDVLTDASLLVNTTTLGMQGQPKLDIDVFSLRDGTLVADIVYKPLETELLAQARSRGLRTVTGLGMLVHQAVPGFEAWFAKTPVISEDLEAWLLA
jgi:shikimate dehydrogenase